MDEKIFDELFELLNAGKFGTLKSELSEMNEVDIAEFFSMLEPKQQLLVFRILPKDLYFGKNIIVITIYSFLILSAI